MKRIAELEAQIKEKSEAHMAEMALLKEKLEETNGEISIEELQT